MIQKEFNFSDGTRIFYEETNGKIQRFIEYSYSPYEKEMIRNNPKMKNFIDSKVKKYNAGKYYYLDILYSIACELDTKQKNQLYNDLKILHDRVEIGNDSSIINKDFLRTFGRYSLENQIQCAAFFSTIYLAMLDLEETKNDYPNSLGKTMVLKSCEAVILKGIDPQVAATMFERKRKDTSYYSWDEDCNCVDSPYEKYNGYNGYDDNTIDEAFDGCPKATWNVE